MLNTKSLEFYKKLVDSGAKESLAQSIVEVIEESSHLNLGGLATKEDIKEIHFKLDAFATKEELRELRTELKDDIKNLDHKFEVMMSNINANFKVIYIVGGVVSTILVSTILSSWFKPITQWIIGH